MADRIRKINIDKNTVHAVVNTDGSVLPTTASIYGLAVSAEGTVYTTDYANHVVYKVFEDGRVNGAVVGDLGTSGDAVSSGLYGSTGNNARLNTPYGICVDASGNIFVSDNFNHKIKRLSPSGRCQTLAGTGSAGDVVDNNGLLCQFSVPSGIAVDKAGMLYVCDTGNSKIKKIWPNGKVTTLAGATGGGFANGNGTDAKFNGPSGVCVDQNATLYVADTGNYRVRKIDEAGNVVTLAGFSSGSVDDVGNAARFAAIYDICIDASGTIFVLDYGNATIRRVLTSGKVATMFAWKSGTTGSASAIAVDRSGFLYFLEKNV